MIFEFNLDIPMNILPLNLSVKKLVYPQKNEIQRKSAPKYGKNGID